MLKTLTTTLAALVLTLTASVAGAAPFSFVVTVDTTALTGGAGAPFWLDFLLIDGGAGSASNELTISALGFSTGAPVAGTAQTDGGGGATGDLATGVSLTDAGFFNDFYQQFTPGASLSFLVSSTANFAGGTPDQFSFSILQGAFPMNLPTTDPIFGRNALLAFDINAALLGLGDVQTFQTTDPSGVTVTVSAVPTPVPEPATLLLVTAGLATLGARRRSTQRRHAHAQAN